MMQNTEEVGTSNITGVVAEQTVNIQTNVDVLTVGQESTNDLMRTENPDISSIQKFLSRPVTIANILSSAADTYYVVWSLFINNPAVLSKIANYKGLRGTLHIRITETKIPQAYGLARWSYGPGLNASGANANARVDNAYTRSCWPGVYTNPAGQSVYEMTFPFNNPNPYFNLLTSNTADQGFYNFVLYRDTWCPYLRADTGGSVSLPIVIEAWMTDVELVLPVPLNVTTQSGEYRGVISGPASTVGAIASRLKDVPVIGTLAKATEIGAGAVASIARLFGFSRPPLILDPARIVEDKNYNLFTNEGLDYINKLTGDPKQENSITPLFGGDDTDPMAFANIVDRFSMVMPNVSWATTDTVGTVKFSLPITPGLIANWTNAHTLTPCAYVGAMFSMWRGTIKIRVRITASAYHQGRLQFIWSPTALTAFTENLTNISSVALVDLSENQVVDLKIPYASLEPFKYFNLLPANLLTQAQYINNYQYVNGYLYCLVYAPLIATSSTASVGINVEVCGGDDLVFARPSFGLMDALHVWDNPGHAVPAEMTYPSFGGFTSIGSGAGQNENPNVGYPTNIEVQSGVFVGTKRQFLEFTMVQPVGTSDVALKEMVGEVFSSFRQVLKAYWPMRYFTTNDVLSNYIFLFSLPFVPVQWTSQTITATQYTGFFGPNPLSWAHLGFYCRRGGIKYRVVTKNYYRSADGDLVNSNDSNMVAFRTRNPNMCQQSASTTSQQACNNVFRWLNNGHALGADKGTMAFEIPYQTTRKWIPNYLFDFTMADGGTEAVYLQTVVDTATVLVEGMGTGSGFSTTKIYGSVAEDFSLDFFVGPPVMHAYQLS